MKVRIEKIADHHTHLVSVVRSEIDDYRPWGGVVRWEDPEETYPDCSQGCAFFYKLATRGKVALGNDWGVCANPKSHRCGLLTFEHQGCGEFQALREYAKGKRTCV